MTDNSFKILNKMLSKDHFSKWLGLNVLELSPGYCKLSLKVNEQMLNGFRIGHGGICFSISDSALAFSANAKGKISYTLEAKSSYLQKVYEGDLLMAESKEISSSNSKGVYRVEVKNQKNKLVFTLDGVVYSTDEKWKV